MRRATAALLLALLAPAWAGCLGATQDGPRLAVPTDEPATVPARDGDTPAQPAQPSVNYTDPGYEMDGLWAVGDGWDYESNRGNYRYVRVIDARTGPEGAPEYFVEEWYGIVGNEPRSRTYTWISSADWRRYEYTDSANFRTTIDEGDPLRYLHNGTFYANITTRDGGGALVERVSTATTSRYQGHVTILLPWGYVDAGKVEHRRVASTSGQEGFTRTFTERFYHHDYLNEVLYRIDEGETFRLVAVRAGGMSHGQLKSF